eukprot:2289317-Rhodomonas_salina.1
MALFSEKADQLSAPAPRCDPQAGPPRGKTRPVGHGRSSRSRRSQSRSTSCSTSIASDSTGRDTP